MQATVTYNFSVAGFPFAVELPRECNIETLLPTFAPFRCRPTNDEQLFVLTLGDTTIAADGELWDETTNDLGLTRLYKTDGGYRVALQYTPQGPVHTMLADERFTSVRAHLHLDDVYAGQALSSLLRLTFAQAIVWHRAVSIHASAVVCDGKGYLFMGKSGTGKSTHSALWQQNIAGCYLLNDDNPTLRIVGNEVIVYGTPWSGKYDYSVNTKVPLAGICILSRGTENKIRPHRGAKAVHDILEQTARSADPGFMIKLLELLDKLVTQVPVWFLECNMDPQAAMVSYEAMSGKEG